MLALAGLAWLALGPSDVRAEIQSEALRLFGRDAQIRLSPDQQRLTSLENVAVPTSGKARHPRAAALEFFSHHGELFGLDGAYTIKYINTHRHLTQDLVHFEVRFQHLPLYFHRASVQVDALSRIRRVMAHIPELPAHRYQHLPIDDQAKHAFALTHGYEAETVVGVGFLALESGVLAPVVCIDTRETLENDPLRLYVHAVSGHVLHVEPIVWTRGSPLAAVFEENPATTARVTTEPLTHLIPGSEYLEGDYARVVSCVDVDLCEVTAPLARRLGSGDGHFIYKPQLDPYTFHDPFAEVNAYRNITNLSAWARETFGWDGLFGQDPWILVKVGRDWYNAAYYAGNDERPPFIVFGQDTVDFAYDADVAFHELGHAINRTLWQHPWLVRDAFGIDVSPFGIEEALADIWAETYAGDPVMNSYILAARTADNTLTCPASIKGEGHLEARFLSGFAWDVRREIGVPAWDHIFYRTLSFLPREAGFDDFVLALQGSAADLATEGTLAVTGDWVETIERHAAARGLTDPACLFRHVPLEPNKATYAYGYGGRRTGRYDYPFGLQWKITASHTAKAVKLLFKWLYPTEDTAEGVERGFRVHVRRGAPVEVRWLSTQEVEQGDPVFEATADATFEGGPATVDFPYLGQTPLQPGEEVFVLVSGDTSESIVAIGVTAALVSTLRPPPTPPEPDAGTGPELPQATANNWEYDCTAANPGPVTRPTAIQLLARLILACI
ncbi:MAG: hypothetical protein QNJ97_15290 [Myxococcota bacterium]|nr:hypothetical protein [Myxococcota bacterium]